MKNSEYIVKLTYSACKIYKVEAPSMEAAHKKAYNTFLDSNLNEIFTDSTIEVNEFAVETSVDGKDGTDMLHY
jgi:hypothetical protein